MSAVPRWAMTLDDIQKGQTIACRWSREQENSGWTLHDGLSWFDREDAEPGEFEAWFRLFDRIIILQDAP